MFMWTLDKFVTPEHEAAVFEGFYGLSGLGAAIMAGIGVVEMILIFAFLLGGMKRLTYGLVFLLHAISTLSSYAQYLEPFDHLLFSPPGRCSLHASSCITCGIRIHCGHGKLSTA